MAGEAGSGPQLLESAKELQAILCCKRGGEALAAAIDGTPQERVPSRPHSLSQISAMLPLTSCHEVNQAPISTDPAGLKPFLSRATAFHISSLAKKHANCSAPDKIHKRERE